MIRLDLMLKGAIKSGEISHKRKLDSIKKHKQFCKRCDKPIPYEKRRNIFCSHSCSILFYNPSWEKKKIHICKNCRIEIDGKGKIYCNFKCQRKYQWEKITKPNILKGEIHERKTLRKYLIEKYGRCCFECGLFEWKNKPIPIDLDHISGDPYNNVPKNLRLLCLNCHGQTPTYGIKNKGNGRKNRKR